MPSGALPKMTVKALRDLARELRVSGYARMKKSELIAAIEAAREASAPEPEMAVQESRPTHHTPAPASPQGGGRGVRLSDLGNIPERYGKTEIVLMVQKPEYFYCYWEACDADLEQGRTSLKAPDSRLMLRAREVQSGATYDIEVHCPVGDWFFHVSWLGKPVCVDLGLLSPDGRFHVLATSNEVMAPVGGPSGRVDPEWAIHGKDFDTIYKLSGGDRMGESSASMQRSYHPPGQQVPETTP